MRKCLRCENEMVENLEVMVSNGGYGIDTFSSGCPVPSGLSYKANQ